MTSTISVAGVLLCTADFALQGGTALRVTQLASNLTTSAIMLALT